MSERDAIAVCFFVGVILSILGLFCPFPKTHEVLLYVGAVLAGGLPVQGLLYWKRRGDERRSRDAIRKLFLSAVTPLDPNGPKPDMPALIAMDIEGCITPSGRSAVELIKLQRLRAYVEFAKDHSDYPPVIFYTGRSQGYVELLAQALGMVGGNSPAVPCVIESGAALYYPNLKKTEELITPDQRQLVHEVSMALRTHDQLRYNEFEPKCYMTTVNPLRGQTVEALLGLVRDILKEKGFQDRVHITSSASAVDITPKQISKLSGLKMAVSKGLHQDHLDRVVALGDHVNDLEVLNEASAAYCPSDAHNEVRDAVKASSKGQIIDQTDIDCAIRVIEIECGLSILKFS
jgi:hydroxymethylpyrimidine pyrophosphatase-like HAD family hydrolase